MSVLRFVLVALIVLLIGSPARAHGTRTAYAEVVVQSATEATISLGAPRSALHFVVDGECTLTPSRGAVMQLRCPRGVAGAEVAIAGLEGRGEAVVVRARTEHGTESTTVLTASSPRMHVPGRGTARGVLARYTRLGVEHVLGGVDHLLLLIALFWSAAGRARGPHGRTRHAASMLVRTATTFTVAHSVALVATALGWLHVPSAPAEAAIALSLVLVAFDLGRSGSASSRLGLIAAFGLVHGLGFAGGLAEVGLPQGAAALALFAFNVGVEIAQLLALGACLALAFVVRATLRQSPWRADRAFDLATTLSSYAVGVTGVALFLLRTSPFLSR